MLWVIIASVWLFGIPLTLIAVMYIGETLCNRADRRRERDLPPADIFLFPQRDASAPVSPGRRRDHSR